MTKDEKKPTWVEGGERPADVATAAKAVRTKAADPTRSAKKAAAKVRRCADDLTAALTEATEAGLTVELRIGTLDFETEGDSDKDVPGATAVRVGPIMAQVSL